MKQKFLCIIIIAQLLAVSGCGVVENARVYASPTVQTVLRKLDGTSISITELAASVEQIMDKAGVAGLSMAILNDSQLVYQKAFGYRNRSQGTSNDEQTIFSAASFSKTVFAYLVMLLVEENVIDLDKPLYQYLSKPLYEYPAYAELVEDERYQQITARMALSHSTGFPNWRFLEPDGRLKFLFSPGERHSYSGEGITLLQMVIESVTEKDLESLAQEKIFQPVGMARTSYIWQAEFEANYASPHDIYGRQRGIAIQPSGADAAGSMVTTASDYARFLAVLLNAKGQTKSTVNEMFQPQVEIDYRRMFGPDAWVNSSDYLEINLAWSLGWGRFDSSFGRAAFHTGHSVGWQNYTVTYLDQGIGIVMLSNSDNFESVAEEIAATAIGDTDSPYDWLGYIPYNPNIPKKTPPPDPVAIEVDAQVLVSYAGVYDMQPTALIKVRFENNQLVLQFQEGQNWVPLLAESENRFFVQGQEDYRIIFIRDNSGEVSALQLELQGMPLPQARKIAER